MLILFLNPLKTKTDDEIATFSGFIFRLRRLSFRPVPYYIESVMHLPSETIHILVVEDNPADLLLLEQILQTSPLKVGQIYAAERLEQAKAMLQQYEIHLVILNPFLANSFGMESLLSIKDLTQKTPVIILTDADDSEPAHTTLHQIAQDYLVKGTFDAHLLARSVRYCIEQKKAQEKIQDLNLQKQHLIKAVLDAQEHERKSIGEVLHDNINQVLTAVKLNLEMALAHPLGNEYLIDKSLQNVGFAIEEIRKLSRKFILSGNIKELGLVQSIHELIKEIQYIKNIRYTINAQNFADLGLSQEQKVNLYRIIQEQLNNIISHADASEATITISLENQNIILKISDNGKGFERSKKEKGIGFTKIINRAELLHGKAEIFSEPGMGCQILVKIPISSDNRPELEIAGLGPVHD